MTTEQAAIDHVARLIASAYGYGSAWSPDMFHASTDRDLYQSPRDNPLHNRNVLAIARRGSLMEEAGVKSKENIRQMRAWKREAGSVVFPSSRMNERTLGALAYAKLPRFSEAVLMVYAGDYQKWVIADCYMRALGHTREASADGMNRILWARPDVAIDDRAKMLKMRASKYREQVRCARGELMTRLTSASHAFIRAYRADG